MDKQNRVWLYARTARNGNREIESQIAHLKTYAAQKSYQIVGWSQDMASGLDFDRDGLNIIKTVAAAEKIDIVLSTDIARIGRSMVNVMEFMETLKKHGVDVITLDMEDTPNETSTPGICNKSEKSIPSFSLNKSISEISRINFNDNNFYSAYEIAEILGIVDAKTGLPSSEAVEAIISQLNLPLVEGVDYVKGMEKPQKPPVEYKQASVMQYPSLPPNLPF